ncbi:MAG: outer rane lipoprotein-sorting protein [Magnetococcales bacterium]|nr:outer rane lipoprotein-sorting protein [Magnetococcales bacterium]HIJ82927.1 outer membrane lipoprotein-sorting protein [Magnetococcales bacterium]
MRKRSSLISLLFLIILAPWSHESWAVVDVEGQNILLKVDQTMFPESYRIYYVVENTTPDRRKSSISLFSAQNKSGQMVVLIVDPPQLRGRSALWDGSVVWTHMPGELEPRKSELRQSIVGGVFNNMDLLAGPFHLHHQAQAEREDKDFQYLKLTPTTKGVPYAFMTMKVDKKFHVPSELVQYARENEVFKRVRFEDVKGMARNRYRPALMQTFSEMNPLYRSEWRLGTQDEKEVPPEAFTVEFLSKLGHVLK